MSERLLSVAAFSSMLKYVPAVLRFILWALTQDRLSAFIICCFNFIFELIRSSHLSSKLVYSGKNSASVWGKISYSECLNTRGDFFCFIVIIRNNGSVCLEDRAMEQIIFGTMKCMCIIFQTNFELFKCGISPQFFAASLQIFREKCLPPTCWTECKTWPLRCVKARSAKLKTCNV